MDAPFGDLLEFEASAAIRWSHYRKEQVSEFVSYQLLMRDAASTAAWRVIQESWKGSERATDIPTAVVDGKLDTGRKRNPGLGSELGATPVVVMISLLPGRLPYLSE